MAATCMSCGRDHNDDTELVHFTLHGPNVMDRHHDTYPTFTFCSYRCFEGAIAGVVFTTWERRWQADNDTNPIRAVEGVPVTCTLIGGDELAGILATVAQAQARVGRYEVETRPTEGIREATTTPGPNPYWTTTPRGTRVNYETLRGGATFDTARGDGYRAEMTEILNRHRLGENPNATGNMRSIWANIIAVHETIVSTVMTATIDLMNGRGADFLNPGLILNSRRSINMTETTANHALLGAAFTGIVRATLTNACNNADLDFAYLWQCRVTNLIANRWGITNVTRDDPTVVNSLDVQGLVGNFCHNDGPPIGRSQLIVQPALYTTVWDQIQTTMPDWTNQSTDRMLDETQRILRELAVRNYVHGSARRLYSAIGEHERAGAAMTT